MNRPSSLIAFFAAAFGWFVALTLLWLPVASWTAYPASGIAHVLLEHGAKQWVRSVKKLPDRIEVETRVAVATRMPDGERREGDLVAEAEPARYGYGLPLFLALLAASRSRRPLRHTLIGYAALLAAMVFCVVLDVLKQIVVAAADPAALAVAHWQVEAIALGYQFGALLLPSLAPVMLWTWLERGFIAALLLEWWLNGADRPARGSLADTDVSLKSP